MRDANMSDNKLALLSVSLLLLIPSVLSHDSDYTGPTAADTQLFNLINEYRTSVANVSALRYNKGAACVAHEVAFRFKDTACTNSTGADTVYGQEQIPDYPGVLDACSVSLENVKAAVIEPNCVPPGSDVSVAAQNITTDLQYQQDLNDSTYKSGGTGSAGTWYVLALATDQPDGNFGFTGNNPDSGGQDPLLVTFFTLSWMLVVWMFAAL